MLRILREREDDEFDYSELDDYESDSSIYHYEVDYFTYYRDSNEMRIPVYEKEITPLSDLPVDSYDADMVLEQIKRDIDVAVKNGDYPGFWVHHINVEIVSNEKQRDVDYWTGSTYVDEDASDYESDKLQLPDDWDADHPDYVYLSDVAYNEE